eukprot:2889306-Prymnesium_polylepis.1
MAPINDVRAQGSFWAHLARARAAARAGRHSVGSQAGFCSSWAVCDRDQPYSSGRESQLW